jgi:hypothetical protein
MIEAVGYSYLCISLLIAVWLGWILFSKHDRFDWHYRKDDLWLSFFLGVLLWPLFLTLRPRLLLRGKKWYDGTGDGLNLNSNLAKRMRRLNNMAENPPKCGSKLAYTHLNIYQDLEEIDVIFNAQDIKTFFRGKKLPFHWDAESLALIALIKNRDKTWSEVTTIPDDIVFGTMAFTLIENGYGEITCPQCHSTYSASELTTSHPPLHGGWNFIHYACPKEHELLSYEHIHIMMRGNN